MNKNSKTRPAGRAPVAVLVLSTVGVLSVAFLSWIAFPWFSGGSVEYENTSSTRDESRVRVAGIHLLEDVWRVPNQTPSRIRALMISPGVLILLQSDTASFGYEWPIRPPAAGERTRDKVVFKTDGNPEIITYEVGNAPPTESLMIDGQSYALTDGRVFLVGLFGEQAQVIQFSGDFDQINSGFSAARSLSKYDLRLFIRETLDEIATRHSALRELVPDILYDREF